MTAVSTGHFTITDVSDGLSLELSNTSHNVPANDVGGGPVLTGAFSTAKVFQGGKDETASWNIEVVTSTGIVGTFTNNTYTVTGLTVDVATVDFVATRFGFADLSARFTVTRSKAGSGGINVVLSNSSHTFSASSTGAVSSYANSGTTIQVFEGTIALNAAASAASAGSFTIGTPVVNPSGKLTVGDRTYATTIATVSVHSNMDASTDSVVVTYPVSIKRRDGSTLSLNVVQSLSKSKQGLPSNEPGPVGPRGTVQVYRAIAGSTWIDSEADAALAVAPYGGKIIADRVTEYNHSLKWSQTKYWTGTIWEVLGEVHDGNLLVTGSVTADKINTNDLFAQTITLPDGGLLRSGTTDYAELGGSSYFKAQAGDKTIFKIARDGTHFIDGSFITNTLPPEAFDGNVIPYIRSQLGIGTPSAGGYVSASGVMGISGLTLTTSTSMPSAASNAPVKIDVSYGGLTKFVNTSEIPTLFPKFTIQLQRITNDGAAVNIGSHYVYTGSYDPGGTSTRWVIDLPNFVISFTDTTPGVGNLKYRATIALTGFVAGLPESLGTISMSASQAATGAIAGTVNWDNVAFKPNLSLVGHTHSAADITSDTLATTRGGTGRTDGKVTALATARSLSIGSTEKTFDGSANVSWTVAEIGAIAVGGAAGSLSGFNNPTIGATANTIAYRDDSADIFARLFRSNYPAEGYFPAESALAFRVNNGSDNYIRFCSDSAAIRTWMGANNASNLTTGILPDGRLVGSYTGISSLTAERFIANSNTLPALQANTNYMTYGFGFSSTISVGELVLVATVKPSGNSYNYLVKGVINIQSSSSLGLLEFNVAIRSDSLPSKSISYTRDSLNSGRNVELYVYNDTESNNVYICASVLDSYGQNLAGKLDVYTRANYGTNITVENTKVLLNTAGLTLINPSSSRVRTTTENIVATSFSGTGADLTSLNASNVTLGTLDDARLPTTLSQKQISKTINAIGASDYHLELQSPNFGGGGDIALRFNQGGQWNYSIRASSAGFRFTNGTSNTLQNVAAATYYMGDNGGYIGGGSTGSTKIVTPFGWIEVGAQNTEYAHFYTDRSRIYFGSSVDVVSEIGIYGSTTKLNSSGLTWGDTTLYKTGPGQLTLSSTATNASMRFDAGGGIRGYLHAENSNSIGFLDQSANWAFRVQRSADRADFYVNNVFINGSKIVSLNDLVYESAATQALASASMQQFKANKDAGLYNNYNVAEGAIAAGYINALFGQFNFLVANNANVTKLRASSIEVSGIGYALNQNPQFDGSVAGWTGLVAGRYAVYPTTDITDSRVSSYFIELVGLYQDIQSNTIAISNKTMYSISLWATQIAGTTQNYFTVVFLNSSGAIVNPAGGKWSVGTYAYWGLVNQTGPSSWTKYGIIIGGEDYPIPSAAVSCRIGLLSNASNSAGVHNFRVQDYRIEKAMGSVNIADGAITASKISVNSFDGTTPDDGDIGITLDPSNRVNPFSIKTYDSGVYRNLLSVQQQDWVDPRTGAVATAKTNMVVEGVAGDGFIQSSYSIVEAVKKSINPDYLGGADVKTWAAGSMSSGSTKVTAALVNPDSLSAEVSFNLSNLWYHKSVNPSLFGSKPQWRVEVLRGGAVIYNKVFTGSSSYDPEPVGSATNWMEAAISISDSFRDDGATNGSVYTLRTTRLDSTSLPWTSIVLGANAVSVIAFRKNRLLSGVNSVISGDKMHICKDTGFATYVARIAVSSVGDVTLTFPVAFAEVYGCVLGFENGTDTAVRNDPRYRLLSTTSVVVRNLEASTSGKQISVTVNGRVSVN